MKPLADQDIPPDLIPQSDRLSERLFDACAGASIVPPALTASSAHAAFTVSPFIAETAIVDPRWFIDNLLRTDVAQRAPSHYSTQLAEGLAAAPSDAAAFSFMRQLHNRELARIAWRDIVPGVDVMTIAAELTAFADACY